MEVKRDSGLQRQESEAASEAALQRRRGRRPCLGPAPGDLK